MKISELFSSWRCWIKNSYARVTRSRRDDVNPSYSAATCWCLAGAVKKCYPAHEWVAVATCLGATIKEAIVECYPEAEFDNYDFVVQFNNAKSTTFRKIRRVLRKANV